MKNGDDNSVWVQVEKYLFGQVMESDLNWFVSVVSAVSPFPFLLTSSTILLYQYPKPPKTVGSRLKRSLRD